MKYFIPYSLLICFQLISLSSSSQNLKARFDSIYDKDPVLYNGVVFSAIYDRSVYGTQFFEENNFRKNNLGISDMIYTDEYINYDVYKQKLLLTFLDDNNAQKMVEIPIENVQFFTIGDHYFEAIEDSNKEYKYYEVFTFNGNKILFYWMKYLKSNTNNAYYPYRFSAIQRQILLLKNDEIFKIKKNKELIAYFPEDQQKKIRSWLKSKKIKIQKATLSEMNELTSYLSNE